MAFRKRLTGMVGITKSAARYLAAADPFRMAGATAFFTSFALPAILIIIVRTLGIFVDRKAVGQRIGQQLEAAFGPASRESLAQAIQSFRALQHNTLFTIGLTIFLLFVATTLFRVIKNSINELWSIRPKVGGSILLVLKSRGIAVAVILLGGLLFLSTQLADAAQHFLSQYLSGQFPHTLIIVGKLINLVLVLTVSTAWFYALFHYLPDGHAPARITLGGAFVTALLFNGGKTVLQVLLQPGRINNFYGASGAIVLVLLFVFYSSIILYFGAALIRAWSEAAGFPVAPRANASRYRWEEEIEEHPDAVVVELTPGQEISEPQPPTTTGSGGVGG